MAKKSSVPASESTVKQTAKSKTTAAPKRHSRATPGSAAPAVPEVNSEPRVAEIVLDGSEVSRLAYSYWVARNFRPGSQVEDWFRAENELRQRLAAR